MVYAVDILQEGRVEPYLSLNEVKFSATANAIDFTNLIEDGSQDVQDRALYELIVRASSKADVYTMGVKGTLNATTNTETGRYRPNRQGEIVINPYFTPIVAVTDFQCGWGPGTNMTDIPLSAQNCQIEREQFIITPASSLGLYYGNLGIAGGRWSYASEMYCQWTYINGWANTFTSAQTNIGDTSITVNDATGVYPGQQLTIWDGQMDESVFVATTYTLGHLTIPLQSGLTFRHGSNVNVSALPAAVKQAVIHYVVALIKSRGQGGLVLNELGEPASVSAKSETSMEDEIMAETLLEPFRQIWGRA